jgi:hypothetical protein
MRKKKRTRQEQKNGGRKAILIQAKYIAAKAMAVRDLTADYGDRV